MIEQTLTDNTNMNRLPQNGSIPDTLRGYIMSGSIRCANNDCRRARSEHICPYCGKGPVSIDIYHKRKRYVFRRNNQGRVLRDINEARDIHAEIRLAINANTFNPLDYTISKISERLFKSQIETWLEQKTEEVDAGELSPETMKDYKGYCKNYFTFFDNFSVREITFEHLENFKDALPRNLKIKTRRNILNALHTLFVRMHKKGVIKDMPAWPTIEGDDSFVRSALTYEEQIEGLLKIPEQDRDIIEFGFETGLRPGETCALKVRDVDVINRQILIQRTWSGGHLIERTKGKNKLWLPLSDRAWEILRAKLKDSLAEAFIFNNQLVRLTGQRS
jgi:site-specific recombinase XerD